MKELFLIFLNNYWALLNSIAIYILIGLIIAGIFKLLLPEAFIRKQLGQQSFITNIKAAVLGTFLSLRSCNVIPLVNTLRKSGASKSATQTFLIATPISGADSILVTYGVFGWIFMLFRIISSIIIALLAGLLTLFFVKNDRNKSEPEKKRTTSNLPYQFGKPLNIKVVKAEDQKGPFQLVLSYAFDTLHKDTALSLMISVILGALIITFIPEHFSAFVASNTFLSYALVLGISIPFYLCASASIPLGLSLLVAGFSPGTVFIFLTIAPATNTTTMSTILKSQGKASFVIYLSSLVIGSLLFGYLFDSFFSDGLTQLNILGNHSEDAGFTAQVSSVILLYLSLKYIFNKNTKLMSEGGCGGCEGGCSS